MSETPEEIPFINLSNGIEAIQQYGLDINSCRFLRIQSTACEQKRWEQIILDLSPDFLIHAALGHKIVVYDYGARKAVPRAIWQGLEWVKFVLLKRWAGRTHRPTGRAFHSLIYFNTQYWRLSKRAKSKLVYYGRFWLGAEINISSCTGPTTNDGNTTLHEAILNGRVPK